MHDNTTASSWGIQDLGYNHDLYLTLIIFNLFSITCSLFVGLTFIFCHIYFHQFVNRTSFRLTVTTCLIDIAYSVVQVWNRFATQQQPDSCTLSVLFIQFWLLASVYYYFIFAWHLHWVLVKKAPRPPTSSSSQQHSDHSTPKEWFYYSVGFILPLFLSLLTWLAGNQYGWDDIQHRCWFKNNGNTSAFIWQLASIDLWILGILVYSVFVAFLIGALIKKEMNLLHLFKANDEESFILPDITHSPSPSQIQMPMSPKGSEHLSVQQLGLEKISHRERKLRWLRLRIMLLPVIPAITLLPGVILSIVNFVSQSSPYWLVVMMHAGSSIQGILNFGTFLIHPSIISIFLHLKKSATAIPSPMPNIKGIDKRKRPDIITKKSLEFAGSITSQLQHQPSFISFSPSQEDLSIQEDWSGSVLHAPYYHQSHSAVQVGESSTLVRLGDWSWLARASQEAVQSIMPPSPKEEWR